MLFRELVLNEDELDLYEFNRAVYYLGRPLNEGILDKLSSGIKKKIDFIKEFATASNMKLDKMLLMFKDKKVYQFFKVIGFSIKKLYDMLKKGFKAYQTLEKVIFDYIASQGGVKYVKGHLDKLDEFLQQHPLIKKLSGVAVSALLIYIWLNMAYNPDLEYSMSWEDMIKALMGNFSLADLFASDAGIKMLSLFVAGALFGLSFPWPGPQMLHIASGITLGLYRILKPKGISSKEIKI